MGHELAGEIVELGPGVKNAKVGDYVSAESHIVCGHCVQCLLEKNTYVRTRAYLG